MTATLAEATPGFFSSGNPATLFALSDVVPLHGRTAVPAHVLVPSDRLVIRGRVFCAVTPRVLVTPEVGDRVVILGDWGDHGTVRVGTAYRGGLGHLALVKDRETLHWDYFPKFTNPPSSLSRLHQRVAEAVSGGLMAATSHLVLQELESPERVEFVEKLERYESTGCRVLEVAETPDGGWSPTRISCPVKKAIER